MTTSPKIPLARRSVALLACATVALGGLAGCSNKDGDAQSSPSATAPTVASAPLPKEPTFNKTPVGAVADVKVTECGLEKGNQTAKLELVNSAKKPRDYSIMVIWLKNDSGTPLGSGLVKQEAAAPGKKMELTAKAKVVDQADRCVLRVLAGDLK